VSFISSKSRLIKHELAGIILGEKITSCSFKAEVVAKNLMRVFRGFLEKRRQILF